jgi:hypothetical protein
MKSKKIMVYLALAILLSCPSLMRVPKVNAATATVKFISEVYELGPENVTGREFRVAVVIENVENLYGLDIRVKINTTYFQYVNHTTTIPWNTTQTPVPPSPYGGILYAPITQSKDEYDPSTNLLKIAYSSQSPAKPFAGNGTVCVFRLKVVYHPVGQGYLNVTAAKFDLIKLAGYGVPPPPIQFTSQDLVIKMNYLEDNEPPSISNPYQDPPGEIMQPGVIVEVNFGINVTVRVNVTDTSPIERVVLFYNITSDDWANTTMQLVSGNLYEAVIPSSQFDVGDTVFYYITATDIWGNSAQTPETGIFYRYHIIPELAYISAILLILITLAATLLLTRKRS